MESFSTAIATRESQRLLMKELILNKASRLLALSEELSGGCGGALVLVVMSGVTPCEEGIPATNWAELLLC